MNLIDDLKRSMPPPSVKEDVSLRLYSTMKVGGHARVVAIPSTKEECTTVFRLVKKHHAPYFVLGGGSNTVFDDKGFDGVLIKRNVGNFSMSTEGNAVIVSLSAGYPSHLLSQKMIEAEVSGFESLYGLPGSIGGAVVMNSKWPKSGFQMSDLFIDGEYILPDGEIKMVKNENLSFSYGYSKLQSMRGILFSVRLRGKMDKKERIQKRCNEVMAYRHASQPTGVYTAGCVFKNPGDQLAGESAGALIDRCGLKGTARGGISVSSTHANFFINNGQGTSADLDELIKLVQSAVYERFHVTLAQEIIRV